MKKWKKEEIVAKLKKNMTYHFLAGSLTNWAILTVPFHHICVYSKQATNSAHHGATTFHHHHHHLAGRSYDEETAANTVDEKN
jgi:hypothetical protein